MKNILLFYFILGATPAAWSEAPPFPLISYEVTDCLTQSEERGTIRSKEACLENVTCIQYPLNDPKDRRSVKKIFYCKPDPSNVCPDAHQCLIDDNFSQNDLQLFKPASSVKNCSCEAGASSQSKNSGAKQ